MSTPLRNITQNHPRERGYVASAASEVSEANCNKPIPWWMSQPLLNATHIDGNAQVDELLYNPGELKRRLDAITMKRPAKQG